MRQHEERAGTSLVVMGALAVASVLAGMGLRRPDFVTAGATLMMAAPLAALAGVAFSALRARDRLAPYAIGALLVTAAGMLLAR
ncbi:MAG TPA: hypothetical protein VNL18_14675 [Gemmatimonadales bacterium]|nr:hypothetical protein [Gemmatimonadales bacterium]